MPGSKVRKLCGCGRPTAIHGLAEDGTYRYKSNCYRCRSIARKFKKANCEKCGTTENLEIDHIDGNRSNNKIDNVQTLCGKCHIEKTKLNRDWMKKK
jgi:5-methylcytosine-specific restriction endonuclease McrA